MTFYEFTDTISQTEPPEALTEPVKALWHDAKNDWHTAHEFAQMGNTPIAGYMPICIAKKAMNGMRTTGIAAPEKKCQPYRWPRNGNKW